MRAQPGRDNRRKTQRPGLSQDLERQETDNKQREQEEDWEGERRSRVCSKRKARCKAPLDKAILKNLRMFQQITSGVHAQSCSLKAISPALTCLMG